MGRYAPSIVLVAVTALLLGYGQHPWSWVAGPVASLVVWALGRTTDEPSAPRASPLRAPTPVD